MNDFRKKIGKFRTQLPFIPKTLWLVWQASGFWMLIWLIFLIIQGLLPVAIIKATKEVIDLLINVVNQRSQTHQTPINSLGFPIAVLAFLLVSDQVFRGAGQWIRSIQSDRIQDYITGLIQEKALSVDLSFYDTPIFYDRLHQARIDALSRPLALLEGMGTLAQNSLTLIGMSVLLLSYASWIPLLLIAGIIPALWFTFSYAGMVNAWRLRNTVEERRCQYIDFLLIMRDAAQELRLFNLGTYYRDLYQKKRKALIKEKIVLEKRKLLTDLGSEAFSLLITAVALLWMISRSISGIASVGDIVLFYQAFNQGQKIMGILLHHTGDIYKNMLFLENLFDLLEIVPQVKDPINPLPVPKIIDGIRFENITFRYMESERYVLQDFNLTLKSGQITAIIGENGDGKTTLIKLLCRFYDPEKGRITVDGHDIRELRLSEWRSNITVLFQEPMRYHTTASENITHGDISKDANYNTIKRVAEAAGAHDVITRLPDEYDTVLGKWFGGAELSAGEWQRVALARAFLRQAKLIILDEPTSMLDVWSEAKWYSRFLSLATGCTVLIISHRLTTTLNADVIHIMQNGQIVESGSHEQLLKQQGRYSDAWHCQQRETL